MVLGLPAHLTFVSYKVARVLTDLGLLKPQRFVYLMHMEFEVMYLASFVIS